MKTGDGIETRDEPNRDFSHQNHGSRFCQIDQVGGKDSRHDHYTD
jgi:hypothetical protein